MTRKRKRAETVEEKAPINSAGASFVVTDIRMKSPEEKQASLEHLVAAAAKRVRGRHTSHKAPVPPVPPVPTVHPPANYTPPVHAELKHQEGVAGPRQPDMSRLMSLNIPPAGETPPP